MLEENQTKERAGFRSELSTIDHIHTVNQLRGKCKVYNLPLCLTFIDFKKAFDSAETDAILKSLIGQGINNAYVQLMKDIYTGCSSTATQGNSATSISINRGVRQGETISPKLFTACLEQIFKSLDWGSLGGQHRW